MKNRIFGIFSIVGLVVSASSFAQNFEVGPSLPMGGCGGTGTTKITGNGNGGKSVTFQVDGAECSNVKIMANGDEREYKLQGVQGNRKGSFTVPRSMLNDGQTNDIKFCVMSNSAHSYHCQDILIDISNRGNAKSGTGVVIPTESSAPQAPSTGGGSSGAWSN